MLSIIVAKASNNIIGKDNKLIWHIADDLKRFKKLTTGHTIIMGRKTFESLGRVLPNRYHIVLSRNKDFSIENENVKIIPDISFLDEYIKDNEEHFVIGGASIYKLLMPYVQKMYITEIEKEFEGDTSFPEVNMEEWTITEKEEGPYDENNEFKYTYVTYERK